MKSRYILVTALILIILLSACMPSGATPSGESAAIPSTSDTIPSGSTCPSDTSTPTEPFAAPISIQYTLHAFYDAGKDTSHILADGEYQILNTKEDAQAANLSYYTDMLNENAMIMIVYRGEDAFRYQDVAGVSLLPDGSYEIHIQVSESGVHFDESGEKTLLIVIPGELDPDAVINLNYSTVQGTELTEFSCQTYEGMDTLLENDAYLVIRSAEQAAKYLPERLPVQYDEAYFESNVLLLYQFGRTPCELTNFVTSAQIMPDGTYQIHLNTNHSNIGNAMTGHNHFVIIEIYNVDTLAEFKLCRFYRNYSP